MQGVVRVRCEESHNYLSVMEEESPFMGVIVTRLDASEILVASIPVLHPLRPHAFVAPYPSYSLDGYRRLLIEITLNVYCLGPPPTVVGLCLPKPPPVDSPK